MRIAFFADIHANLPAFEAALADARGRGATHLICLGDLVGYGPQPAETVERVREVSNGTLMGNHDAAACGLLDPKLFNAFAHETAERAALALDSEAKTYLRDLPYILELPGIACAHSGFVAPEYFNYLETKEDAARNLAAMPGFPLLVVGHTHFPALFKQETKDGPIRKLPAADLTLKPGARYVVNPGAIGFPRGDTLTADYLLYDTLTRRLLFCAVPYDLAPYRLAVVRNGYNPLNYWFLSPSARQRQRELAFRTPTHAAQAPVGSRAPFRAKRSALPRSFWFVAGLFCALVALILALLLPTLAAPSATDLAEPPAALAPNANLLPPWSAWSLPEHGLLTCTPAPDGKAISFAPIDPLSVGAHFTLLSPVCPLPKGPPALRLTLALRAQPPPPPPPARLLFLRADGSQRKGKRHPYKSPDAHTYTESVPAGTTACRLELSFDSPGSLTLENLSLRAQE